jgi:hypothetical protein
MSNYPTTSTTSAQVRDRDSLHTKAHQVNSIKGLDVRRLWDKLHNSGFRDNCYAYYREASFGESICIRNESHISGVRPGLLQSGRGGLMRQVALKSSEKHLLLAVLGVLGVGIAITSALAINNTSSSNERVSNYVDLMRDEWDKYQDKINGK